MKRYCLYIGRTGKHEIPVRCLFMALYKFWPIKFPSRKASVPSCMGKAKQHTAKPSPDISVSVFFIPAGDRLGLRPGCTPSSGMIGSIPGEDGAHPGRRQNALVLPGNKSGNRQKKSQLSFPTTGTNFIMKTKIIFCKQPSAPHRYCGRSPLSGNIRRAANRYVLPRLLRPKPNGCPIPQSRLWSRCSLSHPCRCA